MNADAFLPSGSAFIDASLASLRLRVFAVNLPAADSRRLPPSFAANPGFTYGEFERLSRPIAAAFADLTALISGGSSEVAHFRTC